MDPKIASLPEGVPRLFSTPSFNHAVDASRNQSRFSEINKDFSKVGALGVSGQESHGITEIGREVPGQSSQPAIDIKLVSAKTEMISGKEDGALLSPVDPSDLSLNHLSTSQDGDLPSVASPTAE